MVREMAILSVPDWKARQVGPPAHDPRSRFIGEDEVARPAGHLAVSAQPTAGKRDLHLVREAKDGDTALSRQRGTSPSHRRKVILRELGQPQGTGTKGISRMARDGRDWSGDREGTERGRNHQRVA